jgi:hypothetical protein
LGLPFTGHACAVERAADPLRVELGGFHSPSMRPGLFRAVLLIFCDFPPEHCEHLRTNLTLNVPAAEVEG